MEFSRKPSLMSLNYSNYQNKGRFSVKYTRVATVLEMSEVSGRSSSPTKGSQSDTQRRESDFAGEFDSVRRAPTLVDGNRLISASMDNNRLKRIKLTRFEDTSTKKDIEISPNYTHSSNSRENRDIAAVIRPSTNLKSIPLISPEKSATTFSTENKNFIPLWNSSSPQKAQEETRPLPKLIKIVDTQIDTLSSPLKSPQTNKPQNTSPLKGFSPSRLPRLIKIYDSQKIEFGEGDPEEIDVDITRLRDTVVESDTLPVEDKEATMEDMVQDEEPTKEEISANPNDIVKATTQISSAKGEDVDWEGVDIIEISDSDSGSDIEQTEQKETLEREDSVAKEYNSTETEIGQIPWQDKLQQFDSESADILYESVSSDSSEDSDVEEEFFDASDFNISVDQPSPVEPALENNNSASDGKDTNEDSDKSADREDDGPQEGNENQNNEDHEGNNNKTNKGDNDQEIDDMKVTQLKAKLYAKLTGKSEDGPYGLDDKIKEIYKLLSATVEYGERNSCFVFGPRNSGKTAVLEASLRRVRSNLTSEEKFILIRLNGLAQTDDKFAVRAIAEQLDSEISRIFNINLKELEISELLSRKSINLTFTNILKVLDKEVKLGNGSMGKIKNPIVFIIDEVDVYASQSRQTLLYNLFDLVENSPTPICVLCFTTKFTVKEYLEKRVRSRFSQRSIQFQKLSKEKFMEVAIRILSIDKPENEYEEKFNEQVKELFTYNSNLRRLVTLNHLTTGSIKDFLNHCIFPVSQLTVKHPFFEDEHFKKYEQNVSKGSLRHIVNSLSDLEINLLVSAARVILKKDLNFVNLNLTYEEYQSQIKKMNKEATSSTGFEAVASTGYKQWTKSSCKHPWETLQNIGLLTLPNGNSGASRDFDNKSFETKMWQVELTLDELRLVIDRERSAKSWTRL